MRTIVPTLLVSLLFALGARDAAAAVIYGVSGDYVGAAPTRLYSIDPDAKTTTTLEAFDPIGSGLGVMGSVGPGSQPGELFIGFGTSTTTSLLRAYDLTTGSFSIVGEGEPGPIVGLGGTHYGVGGTPYKGSPNRIYSIDPSTGESTSVGTSPHYYAGDLAQHPTTGELYGVTTSELLVLVDPTDASTTTIGSLPAGIMLGLAFSQDGRLWALSDTNQIYQVDPSDASTSYVMNVASGSFDLGSELVAIPEPSTALLLAVGLARLARRRRTDSGWSGGGAARVESR
jgi:hypothetical protein